MENMGVLKLDSSFQPIEVITWQEAFVLTYVGKAWAVEYTDKWIRSATKKFKVPSVIALYQYIDQKFFTLPCTRKNLLLRDNQQCQYCTNHFHEGELTIDHVIPKSKGGLSTWDNTVIACRRCNQQKANLLLEETPLTLMKPPQKPSYSRLIRRRLQKTNNAWLGYL